jgi:hypothetical protein
MIACGVGGVLMMFMGHMRRVYGKTSGGVGGVF